MTVMNQQQLTASSEPTTNLKEIDIICNSTKHQKYVLFIIIITDYL